MSPPPARPPWKASWWSAAAPARGELWRGVEAQHRVATLRLVDNLAEQDMLEQLLEASKPPLPPDTARLNYLLSTPFRYASPWPSRFRRPDHPGAWYGADNVLTVAAELAHWRWRFFMDSDGLREGQLVTEHTFFKARFSGLRLDLMAEPWSKRRALWRDPQDYGACQWLADAARERTPPIAAIRYESARREGAACTVVFEPTALSMASPPRQQTWVCKTTASMVMFLHESDSIEFEMG